MRGSYGLFYDPVTRGINLNRFMLIPPFQTQVKLLAVYPLPWGGIQTSAAFQSLPGPQIAANYVATTAEAARRLLEGQSPVAVLAFIKRHERGLPRE